MKRKQIHKDVLLLPVQKPEDAEIKKSVNMKQKSY